MTTPMRQQYLSIKSQHPDCILLFRLGDFYETFDDDAKTVARVCDVVLTSRPVGNDQRVPLAGVPYHAVDYYIAKLVEAGYRVAIAEQITEPGKGLVEREVRRVVTKGTVVEPGMLDERRNNYLVAVAMAPRGGAAGLAYCDITTGEFAATQITGAVDAGGGAAHRRGTQPPAAQRTDPRRLAAGRLVGSPADRQSAPACSPRWSLAGGARHGRRRPQAPLRRRQSRRLWPAQQAGRCARRCRACWPICSRCSPGRWHCSPACTPTRSAPS